MLPDESQPPSNDPTPTPTSTLMTAVDVLDPDAKRDALIHALRGDVDRVDRLSRRVLIMQVAGLVVTVVVIFALFKINSNQDLLHRQNEAVQVFCAQTNRFNAETREAFVTRFAGAATNPQDLADFADLAWPTRDCHSLAVSPGITAVSSP